jgi:8-oxo-dGTP pyrophosphatase MutT (NUDIX family)
MSVDDANGELVDEVDIDDRVLRVVPRSVMRRDRLRHRAVFVAVTDGEGRLLVHRRSDGKDVWPGWFDIAVGGVVASGESYESAATREVAEEVGVTDAECEVLDAGRARSYDDDQVSLLGRCFRVCHPGPFLFSDGEITEAWWSPMEDVEAMIRRESFLPDSLALLWPLLRPSD